MDHPYPMDSTGGRAIVYVRAVSVDTLPDEVRAQMPGLSRVYAVHSDDGQCLAFLPNRQMAFAMARKNDFAPVSVN